jgi:hypothetical protein
MGNSENCASEASPVVMVNSPIELVSLTYEMEWMPHMPWGLVSVSTFCIVSDVVDDPTGCMER